MLQTAKRMHEAMDGSRLMGVSMAMAVLLLGHGLGADSAGEGRPTSVKTHRPVIGVLTLPEARCRQYGDQVIVTSNARWLQAGGARVVPIFYDSSPEELQFVLNRVNGVFWTGGNVDFNPHTEAHQSSVYLRTTELILQHVVSANRQGNFYPLWGTCLGFERLLQLLARDENGTLIAAVDAVNYPINLHLTAAAWHSRLFRSMTAELFAEVSSPLGKLAFNNHNLGIPPKSFRNDPSLHQHLQILSVDSDRAGNPFVSTVQGREWPLYGTQWHPEKAPWEWNVNWKIERNDLAMQLSNYFGRFFVSECRLNGNAFASEDEADKFLLHNWASIPPSFVARTHPDVRLPFSEVYCIDRKASRGAAPLAADNPSLPEPKLSSLS